MTSQQTAIPTARADRGSPSVIIIGAGISGVVMGIRLMNAGIDDITVFDQGDKIGGTWRDNTYPGLRCDVPSHYYQYSFDPNGNWSHRFCGGSEIREYYERMAKKYGFYSRIQFNQAVVKAEYVAGKWAVETADGTKATADFLISATGVLVRPRYPEIKGMETFEGITIHSARWDHSVPLEGKRIAIIGNGSTGTQMVEPMSNICTKVVSFQRTPQWVIPVPNREYTAFGKSLATKFPILSKAIYHGFRILFEQVMGRAVIKDGILRRMMGWICLRNLNTVKDLKLREQLRPNYTPLCKRLVMSSDFYPAIQKANVELVTVGIDHMEPKGIVDNNGKLHEVDVVAFATGFHANEYMRPMKMTGLNGITLEEVWKDGPKAYRTVALPGFPNFFMIIGPHSPIGNLSFASIAELQSQYIMDFIEMYRDGRFATVAPTEEATSRFNDDLKANMKDTVWLTGCQSWYLDEGGIPASWPWTISRFRNEMTHPKLEEYSMG